MTFLKVLLQDDNLLRAFLFNVCLISIAFLQVSSPKDHLCLRKAFGQCSISTAFGQHRI